MFRRDPDPTKTPRSDRSIHLRYCCFLISLVNFNHKKFNSGVIWIQMFRLDPDQPDPQP